MTDLIKATEDALSGAVSHPVYVRGHVEDEVPCVVIERPESDGSTTMDRDTWHDVRLSIRVHDRKDAGGFYVLRAPTIADEVHDVLSPSLEVGGSTVAFTEPDRRPVEGYEAEGSEALDILLIYDLFIA